MTYQEAMANASSLLRDMMQCNNDISNERTATKVLAFVAYAKELREHGNRPL